tara:strand:- start:2258 stop:2644 length:387 start_codon:yes stop_codon:yes gene_type:complete
MKIDSLKVEAKRLGIRVTKKIKGKRVPLTEKELDMKIQRRQAPALEIQVRETKKLLRTCKSLFKTMSGSNVPLPKAKPSKTTLTPVRRAPVPPPPPRPMVRNPRANLMTALKANLKKRGIKEKLNQIS